MTAFAVGFIWILWEYWKLFIKDTLIFIDKSNRWSIVKDNVRGMTSYSHLQKKYLLADNCSLLNKKGKSLFIFSENKPAPLKLRYNASTWLTSESIMSILNNDLIQKLVKTSDSFKDSLIMFGAIGGFIAGIASVVILLKQFGVF
jgi:hypothetical protein